MNPRKVARILVCGTITGGLWYLLSVVSLILIGSDLLASLAQVRRFPALPGPYFLIADLLMGIWVMALFALIRANFQQPRSAALICALAWWLMKTLESAKWLGLGILPAFSPWGLAATTLLSMMATTCFGAWLYDRLQIPGPAPRD